MPGPVRKALVGLVAGGFAGSFSPGTTGRLAMYLIGRISDRAGGFSLAGSAEVIGFGALIGAAAGVIYALIRNRLPGPGLVKGTIAGLLTYAVEILIIPTRFVDLALSFEDLLTEIIVLFGICFILFGLILETFYSSLDRRFPAPPDDR